jgi:homocysteine S-methyltransferase
VAASIGPYGAVLADGSEYRGDYGLTVDQLREFHRPRLAVLIEAQPDVLAVETIPCLAEVEALCAELAGSGARAWLSLSADGTETRRHEPLAEAWAMARDVTEIVAVGVNCCAPGDVGDALGTVDGVKVAYPNSGQGWDAEARRWTGESAFDPGEVEGWLGQGARLVGGCCRVGPDDIRSVADTVRAAS